MEGCPHPAKSRMAAPTNLAMTHEQRMRSRTAKTKKKRKKKKANGGSVQHRTLAGGLMFFDFVLFFSVVYSPLLSPCLMLKSQAGRTRARRRPLSPLRQARFGEMLLACSGYIRSTHPIVKTQQQTAVSATSKHVTVNQQPSKRTARGSALTGVGTCLDVAVAPINPVAYPVARCPRFILICGSFVCVPPKHCRATTCRKHSCVPNIDVWSKKDSPVSCSAHGTRRSRGALYEESTKEKQGRPTLCTRKHVS